MSDRTTSTEIIYPTHLAPLFFLNSDPWRTVVHWGDYKGRHNQMLVVPYDHVKFHKGMGRREKE